MLLWYRITKFDPVGRDASGAYTRDDWTSVTDVGSVFGGEILARSEYDRIETLYSDAVTCFANAANVAFLEIAEADGRASNEGFPTGARVAVGNLDTVIRRVLREEMWCKLVSPEMCVHFGFDLYMYVGLRRALSSAVQCVGESGLFIEHGIQSPYNSTGEPSTGS